MSAPRFAVTVLLPVLVVASLVNCADTEESPLQCPEESNVRQVITHCSKHKLKYKLTVDGDNGDRVVINHSVEHFPGTFPPKDKAKGKRMGNRNGRKWPRIVKPVPLKGKRLKKLKPASR